MKKKDKKSTSFLSLFIFVCSLIAAMSGGIALANVLFYDDIIAPLILACIALALLIVLCIIKAICSKSGKSKELPAEEANKK